jgi:tRNA1(Val) A37 N6-methylase TrmN6
MEIRQDPEGNEIRSLLNLAILKRKNVLEIGCGDGRLSWRYASEPAHIVAIEPFEPSFKQAWANMPRSLKERVELLNVAFEDFAAASEAAIFDVVILSWSLC